VCYEGSSIRLPYRQSAPARGQTQQLTRLLPRRSNRCSGAPGAACAHQPRRDRRWRQPGGRCPHPRSRRDRNRVLLFVVTCARQDMQKLLDPISCPRLSRSRSPDRAALASRPTRSRLHSTVKSRLVTSGLVELCDNGISTTASRPTSGWRTCSSPQLLMPPCSIDSASCRRRTAPTLAADDFGTWPAEIAMARKLLARRWTRDGLGVNLLLHGPTGTGKSELARLLAANSACRRWWPGARIPQASRPRRASA